MKNIVFTIIVGISFWSCDKVFKKNIIQEKSNKTHFQEKVGGVEDEFGCVASAGYTWSNLSQDCVKLFEVAYRLNPMSDLTNDDHVDAGIISAFIIFSEDKSNIELFLPQAVEGLVIEKSDNGIYQNNVYLFDSTNFVLYINNEKAFQAAEHKPKDITFTGE